MMLHPRLLVCRRRSQRYLWLWYYVLCWTILLVVNRGDIRTENDDFCFDPLPSLPTFDILNRGYAVLVEASTSSVSNGLKKNTKRQVVSHRNLSEQFGMLAKLNIKEDTKTNSKRPTNEKRYKDFSWTADNQDGIATSTEISTLRIPSKTVSTSYLSATTSAAAAKRAAQTFIGTWADFICKGSVTGGLFQAVAVVNEYDTTKITTRFNKKQEQEQEQRQKKATSMMMKNKNRRLQIRGIPFSFLTFGPVRSIQRRQHQYEWEIPIKGGWLAMRDDDDDNGYFGKLTFGMTINKRRQREKTLKQNGSSPRMQMTEIILQSNIVDYRPKLVGSFPTCTMTTEGGTSKSTSTLSSWSTLRRHAAMTRHTIRKRLYLSTQSVLHAYICWRFHHEWQETVLSTIIKE